MRELFEKQLNETQPLTKDVLDTLRIKTYFNGDEKQIGDVVLFAVLIGDIIETEGEPIELPITPITLNERHFDLFEYNIGFRGAALPVIKLKSV